MVVLDPGICQDIAAFRAGTQLSIAKHQLVNAFVQFRKRLGGSRGDVHGVTTGFQYGLQSQPGRQVAMYQEYPGQA